MSDDIRSDGPRQDRPSKDAPAPRDAKPLPGTDGFDPHAESTPRESYPRTDSDDVKTSDAGGLGGTGSIPGMNDDEFVSLLKDALGELVGDNSTIVTSNVDLPRTGNQQDSLTAPETDRLGAVSSFESTVSSFEGLYLEGSLDNPDWCGLVLEQPELRAELCDLGQALEEAETLRADDAPGLRPHVKQAALLAFERAVAVTNEIEATTAADAQPAGRMLSLDAERSKPLVASRTIDGGRRFGLGWRAAAALVLVALGVTIVAVGSLLKSDIAGDGDNLAEAGITLASVTTHRTGATPGFESHPGWVRIGTAFVPEVDQVLVFGLGESAWLRVREGDRLAVAATKQIKAELLERARTDLQKAGRKLDEAGMLRLEAGEALLSSAGRRPVLLAVSDDLLLVLWNGACHVAIDPGVEPASVEGGAGPALALQSGARAIVYRSENGAGGARSFELSGPRRVLLGADGPKAFGTPAASQFRDLELFGGPLVKAQPEHHVHAAATLWRRLAGSAQRANGRFRLRAGSTARLAFTPQGSLYGATALRVWLRGPQGTQVRVVRGTPLKEGATQAPAAALLGTATLAEGTQGSEPGLATLTVPLPADWLKSLGGDDLVLEIITPKGAAPSKAGAEGSSFEGVAFVMGAPR